MIKSSDSREGLLPLTGIGSLPEMSPAEALDWAFATDIPYYPSLPMRHPEEGLLAQGLGGFAGVEISPAGAPSFNPSLWQRDRQGLQEKLEEAFNRNRFLDFLPAQVSVLWEKFCSRLPTSSGPHAKVQVLGPVTACLALGERAAQESEFLDLLNDWLCAKVLAWAIDIRHWDKEPLVFLDEPGWGALDETLPWQAETADRLRSLIEELQNSGVRVGVHCCSRGDFSRLLSYAPDFLSLDVALGLDDLTRDPAALKNFSSHGGRIAWGVVPTALPQNWKLEQEVDRFLAAIQRLISDEWMNGLLRNGILTPACGLGLRTKPEAEAVFRALKSFQRVLIDKL